MSAALENPLFFSTPFNLTKTSLLLLSSTYNYFFVNDFMCMALIPLWSLTIEEQFYLSFPIFLFLTKNNRQRAKIIIGAILFITFILRPLTIHYHGIQGLYFTQTRCDSILYGCLIYILGNQPWFTSLKLKPKGNTWLRMSFVLLVIYIMIGITILGYSPAIYLPINCLLISALLIAAVLENNIIVFPSLIQKTLDAFAPRSYTIYVIHTPVILLIDTIYAQHPQLTNESASIKIIATLLLILASNEILYRAILLPSIRKGRQIADHFDGNAIHTTSVRTLPVYGN
jgi:peptidoglycan/LPS O-acetylase OafA/YrhL